MDSPSCSSSPCLFPHHHFLLAKRASFRGDTFYSSLCLDAWNKCHSCQMQKMYSRRGNLSSPLSGWRSAFTTLQTASTLLLIFLQNENETKQSGAFHTNSWKRLHCLFLVKCYIMGNFEKVFNQAFVLPSNIWIHLDIVLSFLYIEQPLFCAG